MTTIVRIHTAYVELGEEGSHLGEVIQLSCGQQLYFQTLEWLMENTTIRKGLEFSTVQLVAERHQY